jgi:hypothetical protein
VPPEPAPLRAALHPKAPEFATILRPTDMVVISKARFPNRHLPDAASAGYFKTL